MWDSFSVFKPGIVGEDWLLDQAEVILIETEALLNDPEAILQAFFELPGHSLGYLTRNLSFLSGSKALSETFFSLPDGSFLFLRWNWLFLKAAGSCLKAVSCLQSDFYGCLTTD